MYRIKDWHTTFENNRSRELKRLDWVPVPNTMDTGGYIELVEEHPNGAAHFGAWMAIVEIASRQKVRGSLPQLPAGIPHSDAAIARLLSRISRIPISIFLELIPRLLDTNIGWLEEVTSNQIDTDNLSASLTVIPHDGAVIPHDGAVIPHDGAALRERAGAHSPKEGKERTERTTNTQTLEKTTGIVANGKEHSLANPPWRYLSDPEFSPFVVAACEYWPDLIEEDLQKSWLFTWKKLDISQKIDVVKRLRVRIAAGEPSHFVARPPKYLENGDWKRPPRKPLEHGNRNGHIDEPKLTICPRCSQKPCVCFERQLAKERANGGV